MENENITLNEASIFYKRIDKDTYLIGKDKDCLLYTSPSPRDRG